MTISEAVQTMFTFQVDQSLIDKALVDQGLSGDTDYDKSLRKNVDLVAVELCETLITKASFREGGLSQNFDPKQLETMRKRILRKYGLDDDGEGTITAVRVW